MKDDTTQTIRRRVGGSIDTAYYVHRAHEIRSRSAHRGIGRIGDLIQHAWTAAKLRLNADSVNR